MSIEKIKNPLTKILNRLDSLQENEPISKLDQEYLSKLMIEAYDHLQSTGEIGSEAEEPPKHNVFQFEEIREEASPKQPKPSKESEKEDSRESTKAREVPSISKESAEQSSPSKSEETASDPSSEQEVTENKSSDDIPEELLALFQIKESTELSERLSQMPINDIWNAMGLNERIFTQNELFGGDQETFRSTVQQLNKMENFDHAKQHLLKGAAQKYSWGEEGRKNIAKNFVRLIKRKFK